MTDNLNKKIAVGYFWNLASKWINRSIGVVSTLILIRILSPADFGIAALASIVMTLFITLSEVGTEKYIIKADKCTDELLNSAWSLNIVLKSVCGLVIALSAGMVSEFTNEPVLKNVLLVSSLIPVIGALRNIGLVFYQRELNYQPLTRLAVLVKMAVFPVTITLAFWLKNYWALVIGILVNELFYVIGSYQYHSYRPRWSVTKWREQWSFSQWILLSATSGYIRSRIDALLLGRFLPSDAVGTYRVSQEFAWLPFSELISPATSSLYAGIAKISHNRDELHDKIIKYQAVAYLLVIPSAVGIFALKDQFVAVVMGEQWQLAAPVLGLLSLLMLSMPLNIALQTVLINLSKTKYLVYLDLVMIIGVVTGFTVLNQKQVQDLQIYTELRVALVALFILLLLAAYKTLLGLNMKRLLMVVFLPVPPALLMYQIIEYIENMVGFSQPVNLIILVIIGALVFIPVMFMLIALARKSSPDYSYIYNLMVNITKTLRRKLSV